MSFVGKILVVVQVVLTILFMAFAGAVTATHDSWKKTADKSKADLMAKGNELKNFQAELLKFKNDKQKEVDDEKKTAQMLLAENTDLKSRVETLTQENDSLKTAATVKTQVADIAGQDNESRQLESRQLREVNKKTLDARDAQAKLNSELRDKNTQLAKDFDRLNQSYQESLKNVALLAKALDANKLPSDPREYEKLSTPPPVVQGVVVESQKSKQGAEYVLISLGADDGLISGHTMFVYRSGLKTNERPKYLGKLQIVRTEPDRAVCIVLEKAKNGIIQRGDDVTTKL